MPRTVGRKGARGRQRGTEDGKERVYYSTRARLKELEKVARGEDGGDTEGKSSTSSGRAM